MQDGQDDGKSISPPLSVGFAAKLASEAGKPRDGMTGAVRAAGNRLRPGSTSRVVGPLLRGSEIRKWTDVSNGSREENQTYKENVLE